MRFPLYLLPLLTACGPGEARSTDTTPVWHAEKVVTIGGDSGDASFLSVRSLLFAKDGTLLVVDDRSKELKAFDSAGSFLRRVGRTGSGPGEYRDPYSIAWLGDTLALLDPRNARIELLDLQGGWLGTIPTQPLSGGHDVRLYRTHPASFWALGHREGKGLFIRYTSAGPQDTLPLFWRAPAGTTFITCEFPDKSLHFFAAPFAPTDLQVPTPAGRRAIARTDAYRIDLLGPLGDTVNTIMGADVGDPIADEEWEAGLAEWTEMRKKFPAAKCDADGFDRPAAKPVLAAIFFDPEGRLWVEVVTPAGPRYDIYDSAGTRIASVSGLPSSGEVDPAFWGDRIAIALTTEDGFPRIGIYRAATERKEP
jgi:hypothetical protein